MEERRERQYREYRRLKAERQREYWCWRPSIPIGDDLCSKPLSGAAPLLPHALEERVAEDTVRLSRSVQIANTCIKDFGIGDAGLKRGLANALDHRSERLPGKAIDQAGPARIHIHHAWR